MRVGLFSVLVFSFENAVHYAATRLFLGLCTIVELLMGEVLAGFALKVPVCEAQVLFKLVRVHLVGRLSIDVLGEVDHVGSCTTAIVFLLFSRLPALRLPKWLYRLGIHQ